MVDATCEVLLNVLLYLLSYRSLSTFLELNFLQMVLLNCSKEYFYFSLHEVSETATTSDSVFTSDIF